ncbi:MAG: chromosome segregation protein SMC, partial [Oscillospiraceae bacterium]|nr:chromosome segregation protein SMC [Oscillospiraceae bacterium]
MRFDQGITAVVGPNGSGKSNISDAIRWVLGEQSTKSLRGSKMEDVIFSGTEARRGVGFAEVSLLVDNTDRSLDFDNDDVKVTRRYYRSGDSEYLLNNTGVRLKDVQMLFMDTGLGRDGYSIIGQGRIGDIVASRSEDRREIFEEAAGIAKYRYRKNEAERRLKAAEENLDRLRDILNELEERVGPLAEQSEKAKQYLEYAGEKKHLEIGIWLNTIRGSREAVRDLSSKLELARTQYEDAGEAADTLEEEILNQQSQAQRIMVRIDGIRQAAAALEEEAARCDSRVEVLRNDIYHNSENINRIKNEISLSESGGQRFGEEIRRHESEIAAKEQAAAAGERRQTELALRIGELARNSEAASDRMAGISARSTRLIQELSEVRMRAATAESAAAEIGGRIEQLSAGAGSREQQSQKTAAELAECQDDLDEINRRIQTLQNTRKGYELRHRNRAERLREAKDSADKLGLDAEEARRRVRILEELERNMEGFSGTVKAVIRQSERGALRGIHGAVSQLISAGPEYAVAIETALGAATQYIICENEENAKRAITFLKENREGRATFLPMNVIKGSELNEKRLDREPGFVGMADKLVEYDKKYTQITVNLLGRTAVAEDMDRAVEIAKKFDNRFRVVTLDGQVVNAGGSMTGGSSVKNAGLLARRAEIEKQQARVGELTAKAEDAKAAFQQIAAEASASEA